MRRCYNCGRGGRGDRLSAPALLHLAASEVAEGTDLDAEDITQLVALRRDLRRAEATLDNWISYRADRMARRREEEQTA